jgi:hypothetical protein
MWINLASRDSEKKGPVIDSSKHGNATFSSSKTASYLSKHWLRQKKTSPSSKLALNTKIMRPKNRKYVVAHFK